MTAAISKQQDRSHERLSAELRRILERLAAARVDYCILHAFPERGFFQETDLDIYVERARVAEAEGILRSNGWKRAPTFRFARTRRFYSKIVNGFKLKIDMTTEYAVYRNDAYFRYCGVVEKQADGNGFLYLDSYSGGLFILRKASIAGVLTAQKQKELAELAGRDGRLKSLSDLAETTAVENEFVRVTRGKFSLVQWVRAYAGRLSPARGSLTVALIGLDGAGKGTHCDLLGHELRRRNLYVRDIYLGYANFRLRLLSRLAKAKAQANSEMARKLLVAAYLLALPLEFVVRRGNGSYDAILTDRHPLFEPVFGYGRWSLYDKVLVAICPKPDVVFYLTGQPRVLWMRKGEVPFDEYLQQRARFDSIVARHASERKVIEIDTSVLDVSATFHAIIESLDDHARDHFVHR